MIDPRTLSHFAVSDQKPKPEPRPSFARWLADPNPKAIALEGQDDLLKWIGQTWDDDLVIPLIAAIDERNPKANHTFFCSKAPIDQPWKLGRTEAVSRERIITQIMFATTRDYLEDS
ncbi:hypothetical protein [Sphingomonas melonis]|uniref:hypothetical protein n=1 Tax=Sphingomonas melonis TaxID=152682 RepID=UPI0035C7CD5E